MEPLDFINGIFSVIFVFISLFVGLIIFLKYFKYKDKIYLYVGTTWMLISCPWWPSSLSFLIALSNGSEGLPEQIYFLLGNVVIPLAIIFWILAFTEFLYTEKRKLLLLIFSIYGLIFEIVLFILLFLNPNLIGTLNPPVDVSYKSFVLGYLLSSVSIVAITGIMFARLSLKSKDPEVNLKGKFLVISFIAFLIGAILDSAMPLNALTIVLTRLILIISALFWYGGFLLPGWMKKRLLKKTPAT